MVAIRRVSAGKLRRIYSISGLERLVATRQGEVLKSSHPSKPKAREPFCTKSQLVAYRDDHGRLLVMVHRYLRKDGTIGASGRPDPKRLFWRGTIYFV